MVRQTKRKSTSDLLRIAVHLGAWLPLAWLVWDYFNSNLTVNPIQAATQRTGKYALVMLLLSLSATPLNTLFGFRQVLQVRRTLGLYAFLYASLHLTIFVYLDYGLHWDFLKQAVLEKPFVLVGLSAFLILLTLAGTSFRWWMKRLGKNWKRLHRLVYLASLLVILHFAWSKKGDVTSLQGDILQPLAFGLAAALLLTVRIPLVRRSIAHLRVRWNSRWNRSEPTPQRPSIPEIPPNNLPEAE